MQHCPPPAEVALCSATEQSRRWNAFLNSAFYHLNSKVFAESFCYPVNSSVFFIQVCANALIAGIGKGSNTTRQYRLGENRADGANPNIYAFNKL